MSRMISCQYCGKIHPADFQCGRRPKRGQKDRGRKETQFHSSYRWTQMSVRIRERDNYLCQCCLHGLDGQGKRITTEGLEVHHIESLSEDWNERLADDNLITLCKECHELAEAGKIDRDELHRIAKENRER